MTLIEDPTDRLKSRDAGSSKGARRKRRSACGGSPGSGSEATFSLNSGSAATGSEYRYRVPKSAIERSQSWRKPGSASSSMARPLPATPKKMQIGRRARYRSRATALRERVKGNNDHVSRPDYSPNLDHLD